MAEHGRAEQVDLERTDRLPTLVGGAVDADVFDDAVPLEITATYVLPLAAADEVPAPIADAPPRQPPAAAVPDTQLHDALAEAARHREEVQTLRGLLSERDDVLARLQLALAAQARTAAGRDAEVAVERARLVEEFGVERAQLVASLAEQARTAAECEAAFEAERAQLVEEFNAERAQLAAALEAERAKPPARDVPSHEEQAAELQRASDALALATSKVAVLTEDNRALRSALLGAKNALEERDFLIRRLERGDLVAVLPAERLPADAGRPGGAAPVVAPVPLERRAELIGSNGAAYVLGRRTRIGRSPGCDLQLDYTSVSRLHAQVLASSRDVIVEDLNSTNGVIVNGRKITRQLLNDGDLIAIGEVQLRLAVRAVPGGSPPAASGPPRVAGGGPPL